MFEIVATFYDMEVPDTCKENLSEMDNQALLIDMLQIFAFLYPLLSCMTGRA